MANEWVVGFGLLIDAIGALGIVVPDLPRYWRVGIVRRTPYFRQVWRSAYMFLGGEPYRRGLNEMDRDEIMCHLRVLWPAVKNHYQFSYELPFRDVSYVGSSSPNITIETPHPHQEKRERRLDVNSLRNYANDFIDKWFRILGWIFLMAGFIIQFIGTFL